MYKVIPTLALFVVVLLSLPAIAAVQETPLEIAPRTARVSLANTEITVDGILDEPDWRSSPGIGELIQREPRNGERPTERTDVILLRDENNLYIGVICFDSEPERIIGTQMERDASHR